MEITNHGEIKVYSFQPEQDIWSRESKKLRADPCYLVRAVSGAFNIFPEGCSSYRENLLPLSMEIPETDSGELLRSLEDAFVGQLGLLGIAIQPGTNSDTVICIGDVEALRKLRFERELYAAPKSDFGSIILSAGPSQESPYAIEVFSGVHFIDPGIKGCQDRLMEEIEEIIKSLS